MTLTELLTVMFFVAQISSAVGVAKGAHASVLGYVALTLFGASVAVIWIMSTYKILGHYADSANEDPANKRRSRLLGFVAFGCLLWEIAGASLSIALSRVIVHHIH